ncbi:MAG: hypothetical protein JWQ26_3626, partial [Modestobacter sp.]|nr:hypothetical protein [Modestobacter sp.]
MGAFDWAAVTTTLVALIVLTL